MFMRSTFMLVFVALVLSSPEKVVAMERPFANEDGVLYVVDAKGPCIGYKYFEYRRKPYIQQLFTPEATNILRDAPADHLHHHGLMFAVKVDGINFWEEHGTDGFGSQTEVSPYATPTFLQRTSDVGEATIQQTNHWIAVALPNLPVIMQEKRTITTYLIPEFPARLLTWQSALFGIDDKPAPTYTGTNYNGLGMRFLESMDKGGTFFNANGATGVAATVGAKSNWCAYSANADGKPVTVAMFDHPTNERHPATWYTMDTPFAYLSATLALDKEPLQKMNLTLTYGVAAWDGTKTIEEVEEIYQRWLKLVEPLVASTAPAK